MNKTLKVYGILLVLLIIAIVYIDSNKPQPIDWRPTYSIRHKSPLGFYVFNNEVEHLYPKSDLHRIGVTPYEYFTQEANDEGLYQDDFSTEDDSISVGHESVFITIGDSYDIYDQSTNALLSFVEAGNDAFLSLNNMSWKVLDTLKADYGNISYIPSAGGVPEKIINCMANTSLDKKKYIMNQGANSEYFNRFDTLKTTVLGYKIIDKVNYVNYIKVSFGKGYFYLHLEPAAFSNFYLLKDNQYQYAQSVLAYLDKKHVLLYLNGMERNDNDTAPSESPMRYILSQPALRWAWYLFLAGMFVFIFFNVKRRQRIVPIIEPLRNTTVDFTKTIANLYYQEEDHDNIIDKKIIYFLDKIRQDYYIDTTVLDGYFAKKLQQKTGKDINAIEKVVYLINKHRKRTMPSTASDLLEINNTIEKIIT